jgi:hypothetical protein
MLYSLVLTVPLRNSKTSEQSLSNKAYEHALSVCVQLCLVIHLLFITPTEVARIPQARSTQLNRMLLSNIIVKAFLAHYIYVIYLKMSINNHIVHPPTNN